MCKINKKGVATRHCINEKARIIIDRELAETVTGMDFII